jgi:hypothetical protein
MAGIHFSTVTSTNGVATVTLPPTEGVTYAIQTIGLSYIGSGSAVGRLTVASNSTIIFDLDVPLDSFEVINREFAFQEPGEGVEIKLQCGSQNQTAKLSVVYFTSGD